MTEGRKTFSEITMKKTKKKHCLFIISILFVICFWHLLPKIVIHTPKDYPSEWGSCIKFKDNKNANGSLTHKQEMEYIDRSFAFRKKNSRMTFFYPFLTKDVDSVTFGGTCYKVDCADWKSLSDALRMMSTAYKDDVIVMNKGMILVHRSELYFFRVYADFMDNGYFDNVTIKKYPWSKRKPYRMFEEAWPGAWKGLSPREGFEEAKKNGDLEKWTID